jgi:hypothetical protein
MYAIRRNNKDNIVLKNGLTKIKIGVISNVYM